MRAEIEAKIAQLETDLAAQKAKLQTLLDTVPAEYHTLTAEVFAKIKAFFEAV